jgi:hypothetical protein
MDVSEAKKLKDLERENAELKRMVADRALDIPDAEGSELEKMLSLADRRRGAEYLERAHASLDDEVDPPRLGATSELVGVVCMQNQLLTPLIR